jgi:hypothetical protein
MRSQCPFAICFGGASFLNEELLVWKLNKIHKVGELIAAAAVVVSLLFVGYEVQQNNETQKRLTTRSLARDWSFAVESLQEPELACLYLRMWTGSSDLTPRESLQVNMLLWRVYKVHEEFHYQYLDGEMDESVWTGFRNTTLLAASNQAFRDWWSNYRDTFGDRFRQHMDDMIATTPVRPRATMNASCDGPVEDNTSETGG